MHEQQSQHLQRATQVLFEEGPVSFLKKCVLGIFRPFFQVSFYYLVPVMKHFLKPYENQRCINIGGGNWYYPRWENIDYRANNRYVDYCLDLKAQQKLPVKNDCTVLIFSSHCFEHLSDEDALFTLNECYRIMKPGGSIRISVPDMDKAFTAYQNGDHRFFDEGGALCRGDDIETKLVNFFASYATQDYSGGPCVSAIEVQDKLKGDKYDFCRWCSSKIPEDAPYKAHINAYDFTKLKDFLSRCGFKDVQKSDYRQSSVPSMRGVAFDNRPVISLYVEARKQ